jgi:hypothetical protein
MRHELKGLAETKAEMEGQIQSLLGDAGYARYKEFYQQIPGRATVIQLNAQLGDHALNEEQRARLIQLVTTEPYYSTHGITGELDLAFFGSQQDIETHMQKVADSNQRIRDEAANFLSPEQLAALSDVQSNSFISQKVQGAILAQKH